MTTGTTSRLTISRITTSLTLFALCVATTVTARQTSDNQSASLGTVRITQSVLANGTPLPAGSYELRLTNEQPTPRAGQSTGAERWVEFVADGRVVGRDVATVLRDGDLPEAGASAAPVRDGTSVALLKGGEFLRISVKRGAERYLVYLPVAAP